MTKHGDVFLVTNGELRPLPGVKMRDGLFGANLEEALQTLLQKYPELIPGQQIEPDSEDPPRFVLLRRETPISGMSLDHLFVDQHGVLTLVEAKLIQNPESRRDVIGQIIEYAANAIDLWAAGSARQYATEFWNRIGRDLDEVFSEAFGEDIEPEVFWDAVESNLRQGRVRLIIATDEIRPEVRRMIEYLNGEMQNAEVFGLELKCYGDEGDSVVMVPTIVGATETARRAKIGTVQSRHRTNRDEILGKLSEDALPVFQTILEKAEAQACTIYWGEKGFSVRTQNAAGRLVTFLYAYPAGANGRDRPHLQITGKNTADKSVGREIIDKLTRLPGARSFGDEGVDIDVAGPGVKTAQEALDLAFSFKERIGQSDDKR